MTLEISTRHAELPGSLARRHAGRVLLVGTAAPNRASIGLRHAPGQDAPVPASPEDLPRSFEVPMNAADAHDSDNRLEEVLEAMMAVVRADFGLIQLRDPRTGALHVAGQRGNPRDFIVSAGPPGDATATPGLGAGRTGAAWTHSMPLTARSGDAVGVLTTCFGSPDGPRQEELRVLEVLVQHLADCIADSRALRSTREELMREQEARLRAESANSAKDEFLAILEHEIRQPLAAALTAAQLEKLRPADRPREVIEQQLRHMARLVEDLRSPSHIARGSIDLRRGRLDLCRAVSDAVDVATPLCAGRRHALHALLPPWPVWVWADPTRIQQVLSNVLQNAVFYTPPGGEITVAVEVRGDVAVVRCRDTGVGIPGDALERIFELSERGSQPADPRRSGLGLAIVRRLVELHGGRISASSEGPGRGSEFVVELPAVQAPFNEPGHAPPHGTIGA